MNAVILRTTLTGALVLFVLPGAKLGADIGILGPDTKPEIRIVVDVTEEGKKLPPPSCDRPVTYFPVLASDEPTPERGVPRQAAVHRWLKDALAASGYECVTPHNDRASQLLVFQWGEIAPEFDADGRFWNEREMLDLVVGKEGQPAPRWVYRRLIGEAAATGRYFVRIVAYDYAAAMRHEKKVLWHARVSTHVDGVSLAGIMPVLIKVGGPHFGRDTKGAIASLVPLDAKAIVEYGELEVKEYLPDAPAEPRHEAAPEKR